jgi:hypothetical protein
VSRRAQVLNKTQQHIHLSRACHCGTLQQATQQPITLFIHVSTTLWHALFVICNYLQYACRTFASATVVPIAHESFGRLGKQAAEFLRELAEHAAQCRGGSERQIASRRPRILAAIRSRMSVTLASEIAERVLAYVRGAILKGRSVHPVSALLSFSAT